MANFKLYIKSMAMSLLLSAVCVSASADNPVKFVKNTKSENVVKGRVALRPTVKPRFAATPLKTKAASPNRMTANDWDVLIDEDFSGFTAGTEEAPDTSKYLASQYYDPGIYIDPSLTKDGTWAGDFVYSAGGTAYLWTPNPMMQAAIMTPLGDYSGELTVTCRVKAMPAYILTDYDPETGEPIYGSRLSGSSLYISAYKGGYTSGSFADVEEEMAYGYDVRLYEDRGWTEVELTFENYSADNDGYLVFSTEGAILIDDIKVKTAAKFIAPPKLLGVTDYQNDQFTFAWQPVRKAFNYYIDFYKKVYNDDAPTAFGDDFENFSPQDGWSYTSTEISDTEGIDGSKGIVLHQGDTITLPQNGGTIKDLSFFMRIVSPDITQCGGALCFDVFDGNEWIPYGYYLAYFFQDPETVSLAGTSGFANTYKGIRLYADGFTDGEYVVIDNVDLLTNRPFSLERVEGPNSSDYGEDSDYTYYDYVDETSYTFTDLDPEGEYYVGVRSHYVSLFSDSQPMCALGVAAPEALVATDIDSRGSFTANWNPAPKAQGYTVDLYGIDELEADAQDYTIFEENFDKVDESVTQSTDPANPDMLFNDYEPISLDDYTQYPGWTGLGNTVAVGMLGCAAPMYYVNYISTPEIFVGGSNVVYVTLKAYGTAGDNLYMLINGVGYGLPFDTAADGTGVIDGTFILEVTDPTIQIEFSSYNYYPFILDGIRFSQDLKKGDVVRTHLASADTDAETTSYVFTNLADYDFPTFGYTVTSKFEAEEGSTVSQPSDIVTVDIVNGTSTGIESAVESGELKVVARYGIDGSRLAAPQRGVNILKMSDGSIRKVLVK